jgi:hypothetical protein
LHARYIADTAPTALSTRFLGALDDPLNAVFANDDPPIAFNVNDGVVIIVAFSGGEPRRAFLFFL